VSPSEINSILTRKLISSIGITVFSSSSSEETSTPPVKSESHQLTIIDPNDQTAASITQNNGGCGYNSVSNAKSTSVSTGSTTTNTCEDSSSSPSPFHSSSNDDLEKIITSASAGSSSSSSSSSMLSSSGSTIAKQQQQSQFIANVDFIDSGVVIAAANAANFKRTSRTKLHKAPIGKFNPLEEVENTNTVQSSSSNQNQFLSSASSSTSSSASSAGYGGFQKARIQSQNDAQLENNNYYQSQYQQHISVEQLRRNFSNLEKQNTYLQQQPKSNSSSLLMMIQNHQQQQQQNQRQVMASLLTSAAENGVTENASNRFYSTKSIKSLSSLNPLMASAASVQSEKLSRRSDINSFVRSPLPTVAPPLNVVSGNQFYENTTLNVYGEQETLV
jgi:hypothetical protein